MAWYVLRQNNSRGKWIGPLVLGVEADGEDKAAEIASRHGVYFNGCETGADCPCCGDRWSLPFEVADEPMTYDQPVRTRKYSLVMYRGLVPYVLVHADGRVEQGEPLTEDDIARGRESWRREREAWMRGGAPRPATITLAGVELRTRSPGGNVYWSDDGRIAMWRWGREDRWYADAFGSRVGPSDKPEALDAATRAALAETFRALLTLVPAEAEAIRAEERERCAAVVKQPHDETRTLWSTHVAVTHERDEMAARIRALGPVQP